jgi:hypothetical protein
MMVGPLEPQVPQNWVQVDSTWPIALRIVQGTVAATLPVDGLPAGMSR